MTDIFFLVGVVVLGMAWCVCAVCRDVCQAERQRFRNGSPTAASTGWLLARQLIRMNPGDGSQREALEVAQGHTRWIDDETLLFAPVHQSNPVGRSPWRLEWFGRARRAGDEAFIEARLVVGLPLFVAGRLAMPAIIGVLLLARSYVLSTIAFSVVVVFASGYYRTWRREKALATELVRDIAMKLGVAV
jgi:hypothetical protein